MITISFASRRALVALGAFVLSAQFGFAQSFPSVNSTGTGQNSVPVTAYAPPSNIPASEMPTPAGPSAGIEAAVQSYSVSQATPTSPQPTCQEPPATADYYLNEYTWPTVAQSIAWWESQPGIPAAGTYSYLIGTEYSHQDQEGWAGGCVADPQPACPTGAGYSGFTWGGQTVGWTGGCSYTPQPACSGTGYIGNYTWTGTAWSGSCTYVSPPYCPVGYTDTYAWNGSSYTGSCTQPTQPSCPAGYDGSYEWNSSSGVWVDDCTIPPAPSCPSGYSGSYSWDGSGYVDNCVAPAPPAPAAIPVVFDILPGIAAINHISNGTSFPTYDYYVLITPVAGSCTPGDIYEATSVEIDGETSSQWAANDIAEAWQALAPDLMNKVVTCQTFDTDILQSGSDSGAEETGFFYGETEGTDNPSFAVSSSAGTFTPNGSLLGNTSAWTFTP